jgi:predicted small metal-binding protein
MTMEGKVIFRCRDLQHDCPWEISGDSEEEILPKIAEHGREQHNVPTLNEADERKIRSAIRHREAA